MAIDVSCTGCQKKFRLKDEFAGKKVKCPACGAVLRVPGGEAAAVPPPPPPSEPVEFPPPAREERTQKAPAPARASRRSDDEDEPRPRDRDRGARSRGRSQGGDGGIKLLLILGLCAGGLVLFCVVGGIIAVALSVVNGTTGTGAVSNSSTSGGGNNAQVTPENSGKIKAGMAPEAVEGILGKGTPTSQDDAAKFLAATSGGFGLDDNFRETMQHIKTTNWSRWDNGAASIFVGYGSTKKGDRVAYSFYCTKVNGRTDYHGGANTMLKSLDKLVEDNEKTQQMLDDPKWLKGQAARAALVGLWKSEKEQFEFKADMNATDTFNNPSKYRFLDDQKVELTRPGFAQGQPIVIIYQFRVNQQNLVLVGDGLTGDLIFGPLDRQK